MLVAAARAGLRVVERTLPQPGIRGLMHMHPAQERAIRRAGRVTAQHYLWPQLLSGILLPRLRLLAAISPHEATLEHGEEPWRQ